MIDLDKHENYLNDLSTYLNVEGIEQDKISLIIQDLRENYADVLKENNASVEKEKKFNDINEGLRSANMDLLSRLGKQNTNIQPNQNNNSDNEYKKISFDDIIKDLDI